MSSVSLSSLEELRSTLIRRGLPARYAYRVTAELSDHTEDMNAHRDGSANRLGDLSQLAGELTANFRRRTFAGRHPWLMFVALPFPLAILACIGTIVSYFGSIYLCAKTFVDPSQIEEGLLTSALKIIAVLLPTASCTAVAWFVSRSARRAGFPWMWAALACLPILLFALHTTSDFRLSAPPEGKGQYMFGFILPFLHNNWTAYGWQQGVQALLPILVIGWMIVREAKCRPRHLHRELV